MHYVELLENSLSLDSAVGYTSRSLTLRCDADCGVGFRGVMHTAELFLKFEYLGEIETEFENLLSCVSGAQMVLNHDKTGGQKSRDTLPLMFGAHPQPPPTLLLV